MNDLLPLATAIFSAIATGLAAFAAWHAPRAAAKLAEALRRDAEPDAVENSTVADVIVAEAEIELLGQTSHTGGWSRS